jgi:CheY-like chemotaxis protein
MREILQRNDPRDRTVLGFAPGEEPSPAEGSNLYRKKILWSEAVRSRVERGRSHFTSRAGILTCTAGNRAAFLDLAASVQPDLILIDAESTVIPVGDVCRAVRRSERTASIPILCLGPPGPEAETLRTLGCSEVIDAAIDSQGLQERIAAALGVSLRRYARFPVVLPISRGRIFHEFLGYSSELSEGGMGFETIARVQSDDHLPLRLYRNTEERPISVLGRVRSFRPNIDTGVGYSVGVEFVNMGAADRNRLRELFPGDSSVIWGPDGPDHRDLSGEPGARSEH